MAKTLQHAKYAAIIALALTAPAVFYPQEGPAGMIVNLIYFAAGIVAYRGFTHIGERNKDPLMKYAAYTIIAIILIFAFFNILQNTPYRITAGGKELAMTLMLPQVIYGLAIMGLGISLPKLEKTVGKAAAFAAITYTMTGALYTAGWVMNEAVLATQTLPPEINGNLITAVLKMALIVSIFAQIATIIFLHKTERLIK